MLPHLLKLVDTREFGHLSHGENNIALFKFFFDFLLIISNSKLGNFVS